MQKYIRLLNYENACKLVEFTNTNDKNDYANIVVGGVSLEVSEQNWDTVENFIKSLNVRYEVCDEEPYKVNQQIISDFKNSHV